VWVKTRIALGQWHLYGSLTGYSCATVTTSMAAG
jgi:hypothetical protein